MLNILLLAVFLAQLGDFATTLNLLNSGGREANPVMRGLMERLGTWPALALKVAAITLFAVWFRDHLAVLIVILVISLGPVVWNLWQIHRRQHP